MAVSWLGKIGGKDADSLEVSSGFDAEKNWNFKGQLTSGCFFDFFKFSKKSTKNLTNFCPRI